MLFTLATHPSISVLSPPVGAHCAEGNRVSYELMKILSTIGLGFRLKSLNI